MIPVRIKRVPNLSFMLILQSNKITFVIASDEKLKLLIIPLASVEHLKHPRSLVRYFNGNILMKAGTGVRIVN